MNKHGLYLMTIAMMLAVWARSESTEDFKVPEMGRVTVTHATPAFFEAVKAVEAGTPKVVVDKEAPQATLNALSALTWVEEIEIKSNLVTDVSAVAAMKPLRKLRLASMDAAKENPIDLAPLAALEKLESFDAYATEVGDTAGLAGKAQLTSVKLYMAGVSSIDFLNTCPNVEELNLYGFKHTFQDYSPVAGLKKLRKLTIYMNKQAVDEKLAPLSALTSLEEISMSNCKQVTTLDFLKNCKQMTSIRALWCEKLEDISALNGMNQMRRLEIERCAATDFTFLKDMTQLTTLNLGETAFDDLSLLPDGAALTSLDLEDTPITSVEVLKAYPDLRRLNLKDTPVTDLTPLYGLENLSTLKLSKEFPEAEKAKLQKAMPKLRIR